MKNGEIVLNVSATATRKLTIDNEWIQFTARFNGASQEVAVPISAVSGIFAKETGYGFAFSSPQDPVASLTAATAPREPEKTATPKEEQRHGKRKPRPLAPADHQVAPTACEGPPRIGVTARVDARVRTRVIPSAPLKGRDEAVHERRRASPRAKMTPLPA